MNKRTKLGYVIAERNGYRIRAIVEKGNDTGKIAIFAGKKRVSQPHVNNKVNINKLLDFINNL